MDPLERNLSECIHNIKATRATDRKKAFAELQDLLQRSEAIGIINTVSAKNRDSQLSWNSLFIASHNALLQEASKLHADLIKPNSRTAQQNSKVLNASLVSTVVSKANADVPFLDCDSIIDAAILVLEDTVFRDIIGDIYVNMLRQSVLPIQKYWGEMGLQHWIDLFELGKSLVDKPPPKCGTSSIVEMINLIVKHGCEHSSFTVIMKKRKIFCFLKKLVHGAIQKKDVDLQFNTLTLLVTVCRNLEKECRMAVCQFGEEILDKLLNMYEAKVEGAFKKTQKMIEFLLIIVNAHHPNGAVESSGKAYAYNWTEWKNALIQLNCITLREIEFVQKFGRSQRITNQFLKLVADIYNQIFFSGVNSIDVTFNYSLNESNISFETMSHKKRRITCGFPDIVHNLTNVTKPAEIWPWLAILHTVISFYPSLVNSSDYMSLLQNMSKFLLISKDPVVTSNLCKCCIALINVRRKQNFENKDVHGEESTWNSIWNIVLRTIGLNQNVEWSHALLRHMIEHLWKPMYSNSVLKKLYLPHVVRFSKHSLLTLYQLRQRVSFPNTIFDISVHSALLRWMIPIIDEFFDDPYNFCDLPHELYAHLIVLVCLKNNAKKTYTIVPPLHLGIDVDNRNALSVSDIHELNTYESDRLLACAITETSSSKEYVSEGCVLNTDAFEQLLNLIEENSQCVEICQNWDDKLTSIQYLSSYLLFLLHILKFKENYKLDFNISRIKNMTDKILVELCKVSKNFRTSETDFNKLIKFLCYLSDFFKQLGTLPLYLIEDILETFFPQLQYVFELMENVEKSGKENEMEMNISSDIENASLFDVNTLSDHNQIRVKACNVLLYYSYNYDEINENQYKVLNRVLEIVNEMTEGNNTTCVLQMCVQSVQAAVKLKNVDSKIFINATYVIRSLCTTEEWYTTEESAVVILKLIQSGIEKVHPDDVDSWENLQILVRGMQTLLTKGGIRTSTEIIHCLGLFTRMNISHNCFWNIPDHCKDSKHLICEDIFNYLKHPSHEVRITAVNYLSRIFRLTDYLITNGRFDFNANEIIEKFVDALWNVFTVDELNEEENDENVNRPLTVLYALACTICSSQMARRKIIFVFFDITFEKRIKQNLAYKILEMVKIYLKLDSVRDLIKVNFLYLSWHWFKKYDTFENFPFEALNYKSIKEFYLEFLNDIVVVLLFYGKMEKVNSISVSLGSTVLLTFKNCFPDIMSLMLKQIALKDHYSSHSEGLLAIEIHKIVSDVLGDAEIETQMVGQLPYVLVSILRSLHDPNFEVPNHSILPLPTVFDSDKNSIEKTLSYLRSSAGIDIPSLIVYIAHEHPQFIQKIFQTLYIDVIKASTLEIKLKSIQMYALFCQLLLPYHRELSDCNMIVFVTRILLYNILNFVSTSIDNIPVSLSALKLLQEFISHWVSTDESHARCLSVFRECLGEIVEKLVPLAAINDELGRNSLSVLDSLLNERSDCLFTSIAMLDQLPDLPQFDLFRNTYLELQETQTDDLSLKKDIEQFLNAYKYSPNSPCRIESLKYLRKQLSSSKSELRDMCKSMVNEIWFSENCVERILHRLIMALLQLSNFQNEQVKYEAICCIGEIGLVDLNTVVLQPSRDVCHQSSDPEVLIIKNLCKMLKDYIIDKDVVVVKTACSLLHHLLSKEKGSLVVKETFCELEILSIYPFIKKKSFNKEENTTWQYFRLEEFKANVNDELLWLPELENWSHDTWIVNIVCAILESFSRKCFLNAVQAMCRIKVSFAENIFKYLVYFLLNCYSSEPKQILSNRINQFFENYFTSKIMENYCDSYSSNCSSDAVFCNKTSVQCLLDVVHFIRSNEKEPHLNVLNVNYLFAAKAAQYCSSYFTSILYAELWINSQISGADVTYDGSITTLLEEIGMQSPENKNELLNILREAFSRIGDSDALYGCGSSLLMHPESRIRHYQQIENWQRVVESCDSQLNLNPNSFTRINDLSSAIGFSGFNYLQNNYLSSLSQLNPQLSDEFYESGWKLGKWDLIEPIDEEKTFSYYHYAALKDIHQNNYDGAQISVKNARRCMIPSLTHVGFESTKNIYHVLAKLQCLQDIEDFIASSDLSIIIDNWKNSDSLSGRINFRHKEIIFNQRIRLVDINTEEGKHFVLGIAMQARKEQSFIFAEACLALIRSKKTQQLNLFDLRVLLEEARLLWDRKETYVARYLLKELLKRTDSDNAAFLSTLLRTYGKWLAETNLESPQTIFDDFFLASSNIMPKNNEESVKERKSRLKTYKYVAEFADIQYRQISEYIKSDIFEEQKFSITQSLKQSKSIAASGSLTHESKKAKIQLANQSKMEDSQVKDIENKEKRYLNLAVRYYLKILAESEEEDLKIFRVISFWLHNKTNCDLLKEIGDHIFQIPSYKFVPVLPQLMAHITRNIAEYFGLLLNKVIEKCINEHPHHILPSIMSLASYVKDDQYEKQNNISVARNMSNEERVMAAIEYINKFRLHQSIGPIVQEMEKLSEAYIQLAYYKLDRNVHPGEVIRIPVHFLISKICNFENILCSTITLAVNKNACYTNIIGIRRIEPNYIAACGVSAPKKINCLCTDGETRPQLVKGQDDMRVDAVMQQVFTIMNKLFSQNKHTSKRKLLIRTYKIVPLSQRSGVLEFCTNTISLSEYLIWKNESSPGAHYRFRPHDMRTDVARIEFAKAKGDKEKLITHKKICRSLKPVFRYFFVEKFQLPTMWFERKLAYIHSVAVTSIVGYVLGLGDRHVQNMLIDEKTAEIIHIDFGIAFDQGLTLNCPERIPFRLTRDIEDGMGIFSIDGIFRRCCEQTLTVLRQNSDIILTTSEVFIHDPLYQWTLTPEQKESLQDTSNLLPLNNLKRSHVPFKKKESVPSNSKYSPQLNEKSAQSVNLSTKGGEVNITASRALSRMKLKLQGLEEGTATSIEGQVNRLIQQAKDVHNLSRLFHGWQPYL